MEQRLIQGTDLNVSPLALGTALWGVDVAGAELAQLAETYIAAGGNFFDTAHCYAFWRGGLGESERALGALLRARTDRDRIVVATKCGHPAGGAGYPRPDQYLSPARIGQDVAESLDRLGLDRVDILYAHRDDPRVPAGEILAALNEPVQAGLVRYLGASNWSPARIEEANAYAAGRGLASFVISQPQWSLAEPDPGRPGWEPSMRAVSAGDRAWYVAAGLALTAYTSTARGYFSEHPSGASSTFDTTTSQSRRERARTLAGEFGVSADIVALAWLINQPFPVIPVLGTKDPEHLETALRAADLTLTPDQLRWLETGE